MISIAISFAAVDRHMRTGDFTLNPKIIFYRLDYTIITATIFVIFVFILLELINIFTLLIYYLWCKLFNSYAIWLTLSIITFIVSAFLSIFIVAHIILWPPFMLHAGLKPFDALKKSWSNMSGKIFKTVLVTFLVISPIDLAMVLTGVLVAQTQYRLLLDAIAYAIIVPLTIIAMYVIFYDVTGIDRMDQNNEKRFVTRW